MESAGEPRGAAGHRSARAVGLVLALSMVVGCVVDDPVIETTATGAETPTAAAEPTPSTIVQFEPTEPPAPPTPTPEPSPTATTEPSPTATPMPAGPTPLPTALPDDFEPAPVEPGLVVVPVRDARFMLGDSRPVLQLAGHTLIYVDDERTAEVDIFVPAGDRNGAPLAAYDDVVSLIETDPVFDAVLELTPVSIAGFSTRVFEGTAEAAERAFVTDLAATGEQLGWFPPVRMRLWLIDHPDGPVVVSAESFENPGRYSEAVRLATEILSTITFG